MKISNKKAFTIIELIFTIIIFGSIYFYFSEDDKVIKPSRQEIKYNIKPMVEDDDYDGHRLYNAVFDKKK